MHYSFSQPRIWSKSWCPNCRMTAFRNHRPVKWWSTSVGPWTTWSPARPLQPVTSHILTAYRNWLASKRPMTTGKTLSVEHSFFFLFKLKLILHVCNFKSRGTFCFRRGRFRYYITSSADSFSSSLELIKEPWSGRYLNSDCTYFWAVPAPPCLPTQKI